MYIHVTVEKLPKLQTYSIFSFLKLYFILIYLFLILCFSSLFFFSFVCVTGVLPVTHSKRQPADRLTVHCTKVKPKQQAFPNLPCCLEKKQQAFPNPLLPGNLATGTSEAAQ